VRIDLISEHASPLALLGGVDAGGQNVHVAALAEALALRGAEVRVFTRRDDPAAPTVVPFAPGVVVVHVDAGPAEPVPKDELWPLMDEFAAVLAGWWREDRSDVAHAHFWMSGYAALTAARPAGVPVAMTYHALGIVKREQQGAADTSPPARIGVEARLAREADRVIATSSAEAARLVQLGAARRRISVIPCGVDLARFRVARQPRRSDSFEVLVVSRLVERKGIGNVIEALASLPGAHLTVAGGPPPGELGTDPLACRLRALAERFGVDDRVDLVGAVPRHEVPALMHGADVVACCPWYEPFGMVAVEAMACGVPVVATAVGGLAETVVDGRTGLQVPPRQPSAIAAALAALRDDPALRARMGSAAVLRAQRYGWDRVAQATEAALASISEQPVAAAAGASPA
jgi:glycosyltransferase involved in cell wall biosynthesis